MVSPTDPTINEIMNGNSCEGVVVYLMNRVVFDPAPVASSPSTDNSNVGRIFEIIVVDVPTLAVD